MSTTGSERLCQDQFETAVELVDRYVHASHVDDYYFGFMSGLALLSMIPETDDHAVVLDIGAGTGKYLNEIGEASIRPLKKIGIAAIKSKYMYQDGIEWVFGDFQRPDTWEPKHVLRQSSVDMAVSSLTFQHFADPIRALQNANRLMREGGNLFIDDIVIPIERTTARRTIDEIESQLHANEGSYGFGSAYNETRHELKLANVHIQKQTETILDSIGIVGDSRGRAIYSI